MMMLVGLGCFTQLRHRESHSTLHVHSDFKELRSSYTLPRSASDGEKDAIKIMLHLKLQPLNHKKCHLQNQLVCPSLIHGQKLTFYPSVYQSRGTSKARVKK